MNANTPRRRGAFTLLELLMVVIIIGILAAMALPQFIRAAEKARATEAFNLLGTVRSAENRYRAMEPSNQYTEDLLNLDVEIPTPNDWTVVLPSVTAGNPSKGHAEMKRTAGDFKDQVIGIQFTTGTRCGNFSPYFGATTSTCVDD